MARALNHHHDAVKWSCADKLEYVGLRWGVGTKQLSLKISFEVLKYRGSLHDLVARGLRRISLCHSLPDRAAWPSSVKNDLAQVDEKQA